MATKAASYSRYVAARGKPGLKWLLASWSISLYTLYYVLYIHITAKCGWIHMKNYELFLSTVTDYVWWHGMSSAHTGLKHFVFPYISLYSGAQQVTMGPGLLYSGAGNGATLLHTSLTTSYFSLRPFLFRFFYSSSTFQSEALLYSAYVPVCISFVLTVSMPLLLPSLSPAVVLS